MVQRWAKRRLGVARRLAGRSADVVNKIRAEAKKNGATLANDGEGGLDSNLALRIFQKDGWTCQIPKCKTAKEELDLDHIGGHPHELGQDPEADKWLKDQAKKGKQDTEDGLHVLCLRHHDMVHQRERAIENGKKPPAMAK